MTGNKQVRKKRHVAAVPLISDASTSVRTVPSRRVQFPPLRFVSDNVRAATKPYVTRTRISKNLQSSCATNQTNMTCLHSNADDKVADCDVCSEDMEQEVQAETTEDMHLTERHRMTNTLAVACESQNTTDNVNSCSDQLMSCIPVCLKSPCHEADPASCNHVTDGRQLDVNDEKSPNFVVNEKDDLTVCAENVSAMHFDINTPSCEVETLNCNEESPHEVVSKAETATATCQNMSCPADRHFVEPVRVLSFSRLDRSLNETEDPVEHVICAAELNENMSDLLDRDDEPSVNALVDCRQSFCRDNPEFFSTLNTLTPLEKHCKNTVLVSDTPVSDYGYSYRQRALKAGNIRLRHRTHKS